MVLNSILVVGSSRLRKLIESHMYSLLFTWFHCESSMSSHLATTATGHSQKDRFRTNFRNSQVNYWATCIFSTFLILSNSPSIDLRSCMQIWVHFATSFPCICFENRQLENLKPLSTAWTKCISWNFRGSVTTLHFSTPNMHMDSPCNQTIGIATFPSRQMASKCMETMWGLQMPNLRINFHSLEDSQANPSSIQRAYFHLHSKWLNIGSVLVYFLHAN